MTIIWNMGDRSLFRNLRPPPYWSIYIVLVAVFYVLVLFIPKDNALPAVDMLKIPAKAILDLTVQTTNLVASLNTAMVTVAGLLAVKGREWSVTWGWIDGIGVMLAFVAAAVSYMGVFIGYMSLLSTVAKGSAYPLTMTLSWARGLEFYGSFIGIFLVGLIFSRMLEGRMSYTCGSVNTNPRNP